MGSGYTESQRTRTSLSGDVGAKDISGFAKSSTSKRGLSSSVYGHRSLGLLGNELRDGGREREILSSPHQAGNVPACNTRPGNMCGQYVWSSALSLVGYQEPLLAKVKQPMKTI